MRFEGGKGQFITSQTLSPFEAASSQVASLVLNESAVRRYVEQIDLTHFPCLGEELLILTHPSFRPAADSLATWKRSKGIATTVRNVGAGTAFTTGAQIDELIEDRYRSCLVRPSYVLLLGDSEFVPPSRTDWDSTMPDTCTTCGDETTGSDWGYALYPQFIFDIFPDFGVGRIPADTLTEAQRVVDKTIQYESSPPFLGLFGGAPFYTSATNASYFQCCRTDVMQAGTDMRSFVETSEVARNVLLGRSYSVDRIYDTNTDFQDAFVADATPRRFFDGTALPAGIAPGSGFSWNGSTQNVIDAFNAGRFLVFHRDHGGNTSWGDPAFSTGNFASLTNGPRLPFVYSVNCASGNWDRETDGSGTSESFMEQLLLVSGGGMVGGLGDNRNSPTWVNSALARGFFDATWPETAPGFGGGTSERRLGRHPEPRQDVHPVAARRGADRRRRDPRRGDRRVDHVARLRRPDARDVDAQPVPHHAQPRRRGGRPPGPAPRPVPGRGGDAHGAAGRRGSGARRSRRREERRRGDPVLRAAQRPVPDPALREPRQRGERRARAGRTAAHPVTGAVARRRRAPGLPPPGHDESYKRPVRISSAR